MFLSYQRVFRRDDVWCTKGKMMNKYKSKNLHYTELT